MPPQAGATSSTGESDLANPPRLPGPAEVPVFAQPIYLLNIIDQRDHGPEVAAMFDEMDRLREIKELHDLLTHYASLAAGDREVWQDRLCELAGVEPRQLSKFHGELLAFGWLEQNTGLTPILKRGAAPSCYRITSSGLRALKQLRSEEVYAT
jgi:hypothetical protein